MVLEVVLVVLEVVLQLLLLQPLLLQLRVLVKLPSPVGVGDFSLTEFTLKGSSGGQRRRRTECTQTGTRPA